MIDASEHLGLVGMIVGKRVRPDHPDADEYRGVATLALVRAARDYDPAKGRFSTYACRAIINAVNCEWNYRHRKRRDARRTVGLTDGVARWCGVRDKPGRMELDDERRDTMDRAATCLAALDERGADVLMRRASGMTLREIGADLGLSRERVRQIERDAIAAARQACGELADGRAWATYTRRA